MSSIRYNKNFKLEIMTTLDNQLLGKAKDHNIMFSLVLLFSMLLTLNATANTNRTKDTLSEYTLNRILFANNENVTTNDLDISTIEIIEIEEEVVLDFDTKQYLPKGFNALKGKDDLDWSKIEIIEIEEDLELNSHSKFVCTL